jgi:queuosine precursor transporter
VPHLLAGGCGHAVWVGSAMKAAAALSVAFLATIPAANWLIGHWGSVCLAHGPCLVPVWPWPLVLAPSGSLMIGVALVIRNGLQTFVARWWILVLIACGGLLSAVVAPVALAAASACAFTTSELADWAVYTPLRRRRLLLAVMAAGTVGAFVDATVFITMAFGGEYSLIPGQVIAKVWASAIAVGCLWTARHLLSGDSKSGMVEVVESDTILSMPIHITWARDIEVRDLTADENE